MISDLILRWASVGFFVLLMLAIGFYSMRRTKNVHDFFLGGRNVGPWMTAFAYGTTYFSAVLFIGYAGGLGFGFGLPVVWIAIGNALVGGLLAWLVLAKRTRAMTVHLGTMTMPEFLEARYDSRWLKIVSALIIFIFMIPYSGSVYSGLSFLFVNVLNVNYTTALVFMTLLTGVYLLMGGYFAVALSDFIQGIIMVVGTILMVGYIFQNPTVGGLTGYFTKMKSVDSNLLSLFPKGGMGLLWLVLMTSFGVWGLPQMVQKFYAIKNQRVILTATVVSTLFCIVISGAAYLVGSTSTLFGPELVKANPKIFSSEPNYNQAIEDPGTARQVLGGAMKDGRYKNTMIIPQMMQLTLPNGLLIIILLLVLSASMSTLSSLVLVSASAISIDLLQGHFFPEISRKQGMIVMRSLCGIFILLSLIVAVYGEHWPYLVALMSFSWGTVAGAFLAPYIYGLFWKGVTKAGAWAGLVAGAGYSVAVFVWHAMDPVRFNQLKAIAPQVGAIAMFIPLLVVPLVSWITPKFATSHIERVFDIKEESYYETEEAAPAHEY